MRAGLWEQSPVHTGALSYRVINALSYLGMRERRHEPLLAIETSLLNELQRPGRPRKQGESYHIGVCQHPCFQRQGNKDPEKGAVGQKSHSTLNNGARALPPALSCNLSPFLFIPHPLSKCENSEAIARNGKP